MTTTRIPARMPADLQTRDSSIKQPIQTLQPTTGRDSLGTAEAAIVHLACAHPLAWPACAHRMELTTTAQTLELRGATPIVPLYALVYGILKVTGDEDIVDISLTTSYEPTPVEIEVPVWQSTEGIQWQAQVQIGAGQPVAVNLNHSSITVEINKNNLSTTAYLECIGVSPLPMGSPWSGDTIEV